MNEVKVETKAIVIKKEWITPEVILLAEIIEHSANTVSDGTGNLFS